MLISHFSKWFSILKNTNFRLAFCFFTLFQCRGQILWVVNVTRGFEVTVLFFTRWSWKSCWNGFQTLKKEIEQNQIEIDKYIGEQPKFFSYPYGESSKNWRSFKIIKLWNCFSQHSAPIPQSNNIDFGMFKWWIWV